MASTQKQKKSPASPPSDAKRPPSIQSTSQLAKQLNLSRWTVSRVLNGHDDVRPDTAERVRAAMREYGFAPNPLAQGLRRGRTDIVGVCTPGLEDFNLSQKLDYLRSALAEESLQVMIGMTNNTLEEEIRTLNHFHLSRAAGVVLFATKLPPDHPAILQFTKAGTPLICVDPISHWPTTESLPTPPAPEANPPHIAAIEVDRVAGMREATEHLLALGHRSIALLGILGESRYTVTRRQAVQQTVESASSQPLQLHSFALPEASNLYMAGRLSAAAHFHPAQCTPDSPTAILALNDRVAIGLIDGLQALGLCVPGDLSIIGYDNMEICPFLKPALTTIATQPEALIYETTQALLHHLNSSPKTEKPPTPITSTLFARSSTGPAPGSR